MSAARCRVWLDPHQFRGGRVRVTQEIEHITAASVAATQHGERARRLDRRLDVEGVAPCERANFVAVDVNRQQIDVNADGRCEVDVDRVRTGEVNRHAVVARRAVRDEQVRSADAVGRDGARRAEVDIADCEERIDRDLAGIDCRAGRVNNQVRASVAVHRQRLVVGVAADGQRFRVEDVDRQAGNRQRAGIRRGRSPVRRVVGPVHTGHGQRITSGCGQVAIDRDRDGQSRHLHVDGKVIVARMTAQRGGGEVNELDGRASIHADREVLHPGADQRDSVVTICRVDLQRGGRAGTGDSCRFQFRKADRSVCTDNDAACIGVRTGIERDRHCTGSDVQEIAWQ